MKVAYIISSDLYAGKEAQLYMLLLEMERNKVETTTIVFNNSKFTDKLKTIKTNLINLDEKRGFLALLKESIKELSLLKPDVLVAQNYKEAVIAAVYKLKYRCKLILHFHGFPEKKNAIADFNLGFYFFLEKLIAKYLADFLIFPSEDLKHKLKLDLRKSKVIFNSYPITFEKEELSLKEDFIIQASRLTSVKQIEVAIRGYSVFLDKYFKDSSVKPSFLILGEGEERERLSQLIKNLKLEDSVKLLGYKNNILNYMKKAKLLLLSSKHEGIPTVLLEAISQMKPIVSTRVGGIPEVMNCFEGYPMFYYHPLNIQELADRIFLAWNFGEIDNLKKVEYEKNLFDNFSAEKIAKKHLELYQS